MNVSYEFVYSEISVCTEACLALQFQLTLSCGLSFSTPHHCLSTQHSLYYVCCFRGGSVSSKAQAGCEIDLGHLNICQGVRGKARAHAFNGLLVGCPLLLQSANHMLHFALPREEVIHAHLQCLNLLTCSLVNTTQ